MWVLAGAVIIVAATVAIRIWPERFAATVGGPLRAPTEARVSFGPEFWRRECEGLAWSYQSPDGEHRACLGAIDGERQFYRDLGDAEPWRPAAIPNHLRAADVLRDVRPRQPREYTRAEVLSWRKQLAGRDAEETEEVLVAAQSDTGAWRLTRARYERAALEPRSDAPRWSEYYELHAPPTGFRELARRPSEAELHEFVTQSGWYALQRSDHFTAWCVDERAWEWASGRPDSVPVEAELANVRTYRAHD
jgi:hypothetical protein